MQLKLAPLARSQRRTLLGEWFVVRQHMPDNDGQFAGRRYSGDLLSTSTTDAEKEGAQWPGSARKRPRLLIRPCLAGCKAD